MITKHQKGFTLIEIMFVVAILGALTILGLSAYEQKVMNRKIDKAAIEMQTWLQASLKYYTDHNGKWPDLSKDQNLADILLADNYMPEVATNNPWYPISDTNGRFLLYPTANGNTIQVVTALPSNLNNPHIPQMIAGRLPFAYVDKTNPYQVVLEMALPTTALASSTNNVLLGGVYIINPNDPNSQQTVTKPDCPDTYHPEIHVAVNEVVPPTNPNHQYDSLSYFKAESGIYNIPENYWKPYINVLSNVRQGTGSVMAITTCVKDTTQAKANKKTNHYIF